VAVGQNWVAVALEDSAVVFWIDFVLAREQRRLTLNQLGESGFEIDHRQVSSAAF
jgi:hypothetical protein